MAVSKAPPRAARRIRSVFSMPRLLSAGIAMSLLLTLGATSPAVTNASSSPANAIIAAARSHLGAGYQRGATGPYRFDCSGLVFAVFRQTHELPHIGGTRRTAAGYMHWFAARGRASRSGGQPGDLVIYNGGTHVGIYIGGGKVISALTSGVRLTGLHQLNIPFTEFLHTRLSSGLASAATPPTTSSHHARRHLAAASHVAIGITRNPAGRDTHQGPRHSQGRERVPLVADAHLERIDGVGEEGLDEVGRDGATGAPWLRAPCPPAGGPPLRTRASPTAATSSPAAEAPTAEAPTASVTAAEPA